jgi:hypothetical protein
VVGVDCGFYRDGWLYNDGRPRPLTFTQDMRRLTLTDVEGFDAVVHLGIDKGRHRVALARRDIFYWATLILLCNQLLGVITSLPSLSMAKVFTNLAEVGIFQYMAWYAIFRLLSMSDPTPSGEWRDFLVAAIFCLLLFLPTSRFIWIAATGIASYLWVFVSGDRNMRAAGIVLAALAVQQFWGHIFFSLVAFPLLRAETAMIGTMLEVTRPGTVWQDNVITGPSGYGIIIYTGCSSFHNLSLAFLCWVTLTRLRMIAWRGRDFRNGILVGVVMLLLNLARIYMMGLNYDLYYFWHEGMGADIFAIGASLIIISLTLYLTRLRPA